MWGHVVVWMRMGVGSVTTRPDCPEQALAGAEEWGPSGSLDVLASEGTSGLVVRMSQARGGEWGPARAWKGAVLGARARGKP